MHQHSLEAYSLLPTQKKSDFVFTAYQDGEELSDRQAKNKLHLGDMNEVRPRITEMVTGKSGKHTVPIRLRQIGKRKENGRTVRICVMIEREPEQVELF